MKSFKTILAAVVVIVATLLASAPASAAGKATQSKASYSLLSYVPESIVVEQTATLDNGTSVKLYYKKSGDICEVYSENDLSGYEISDLARINETSFRIVSAVKGKRVYKTTVAKASKIIKNVVMQCL